MTQHRSAAELYREAGEITEAVVQALYMQPAEDDPFWWDCACGASASGLTADDWNDAEAWTEDNDEDDFAAFVCMECEADLFKAIYGAGPAPDFANGDHVWLAWEDEKSREFEAMLSLWRKSARPTWLDA